jgi:F-type H+-transporting ATPase subunit delta
VSQVASRYARALLAQLEKEGRFAAFRPTLVALANLPETLTLRLDDSTIPMPDREKAVRVSLGNPEAGSLLSRFVDLLARRRRLGQIAKICQSVLELESRTAGIVEGSLLSHTVLDKDVVTRLEAGLSGPGRQVRLTNSVDSSILGGFRVHLGATVLDATINNQLHQARKALLSA